MHRHRIEQQGADPRLDVGFADVEAIGGPGRRVGRDVMDPVHHAEEGAMVKQAMRPVKVGVVNEDRDQETDEIPWSIHIVSTCTYIFVRTPDLDTNATIPATEPNTMRLTREW